MRNPDSRYEKEAIKVAIDNKKFLYHWIVDSRFVSDNGGGTVEYWGSLSQAHFDEFKVLWDKWVNEDGGI